MRKLVRITLSRPFAFALALIIQFSLAILLLSVVGNGVGRTLFAVIYFGASVFCALYVISLNIGAEYKTAWLCAFLALPIAALPLFFIYGNRAPSKKTLEEYNARNLSSLFFQYDQGLFSMLAEKDEAACNYAKYVYGVTDYALQSATEAVYLNGGESYLKQLTAELNKAERYVFLAFYSISFGKMWDAVFGLLRKKAEQGVAVKLIYDDFGCSLSLSQSFCARCAKAGIEAIAFNKLSPYFKPSANNRMHGKLVVIDGAVCFTGGINLGDEYLNRIQPFGRWKDCAVMLKGSVAESFTRIFLRLWTLEGEFTDAQKFLPAHVKSERGKILCSPFLDAPFDKKHRAFEQLVIKILSNARAYVYICTPYLVLGSALINAIIAAKRSGVDVKICLPGKPDKKAVYALTKAYYSLLCKEGVQIYLFNGFIHSKSLVSDYYYCLLGSSNMDFRSMYLQFETDVLIYDDGMAECLNDDFDECMANSEEVVLDKQKDKLGWKIALPLLRLIAPLV